MTGRQRTGSWERHTMRRRTGWRDLDGKDGAAALADSDGGWDGDGDAAAEALVGGGAPVVDGRREVVGKMCEGEAELLEGLD